MDSDYSQSNNQIILLNKDNKLKRLSDLRFLLPDRNDHSID